jgi:hypothetical protein
MANWKDKYADRKVGPGPDTSPTLRESMLDDTAFDNMQRATRRTPDRMFKEGKLFTESEYNTYATTKERRDYDSRAYSILQDLYAEDKAKDRFQTFDFPQFLENIDREYLEEKFMHSRKGDPKYYSEAGDLLRDIYGGDTEQLKLSAFNFESKLLSEEAARDRSNVSIKAPRAESY